MCLEKPDGGEQSPAQGGDRRAPFSLQAFHPGSAPQPLLVALGSGPTPGEDRRPWARLTFSLLFLCRCCVFLPPPRPWPSLLHVALTLSVGRSAWPSALSGQKPAHQPWEQRPRGLLRASGKKSRLPRPVGLAEALPALWWFAGGEDLPGGRGRTARVPRPGGERHVCRALRASWTGAGGWEGWAGVGQHSLGLRASLVVL